MLGKLLKHELKAISRILLPLHIILLVCSVIGRFLLTPHLYNPGNPSFVILTILSALFFIISGSMLVTSLVIAVRFYKSMFTSEGYLTWTLPATPGQHFLARIISGTLWLSLNILCIFLAVFALLFTRELMGILPALESAFLSDMGISLPQFSLLYFSIMIFSTPVSVVLIYFCIVIGQLFSSHRVVGAIVAYFCLTIFTSILTYAFLLSSPHASILTQMTTSPVYMRAYMSYLLQITLVISVIQGSIGCFGSYYILNKKINLL